ncbi:hypothetical protein [Actinomycetospora chiangmaiensis]|uniref:hypothetical protein n=1 Tax=Actinomycetospora chiangmaiensis TaxID=402650 RepID=UPI0012FB46DF|nr:hypothetical protein [Actinomycetospora chiangmaiensis]
MVRSDPVVVGDVRRPDGWTVHRSALARVADGTERLADEFARTVNECSRLLGTRPRDHEPHLDRCARLGRGVQLGSSHSAPHATGDSTAAARS